MSGSPTSGTSAERRALLAALLGDAQLHPLSRNQRALWFAHQMSPSSAAYNVMLAWRIRAGLDMPALERAFQALVERHPALRTTYVSVEGEPRQYVRAHLPLCLELRDGSGDEERLRTEVADEAHRPFDLERGPLLRVTLFREPSGSHVLLLVVHHIAIDVWSLGVLLGELGQLYPGAASSAVLPPLGWRYVDSVRSQRAMLAGAEGARLWDYWRRKLAGELPLADLSPGRLLPGQRSGRGAGHCFSLDAGLTGDLARLAEGEGATLYTLLLAAFQVLISRYTGQTEVIVGTPADGRLRPEEELVVGYFVNPLPLRADLSANPPFREFLAQARETVLEALAHQAFPFPDMVDRLGAGRDPARPPLFQTSFVLQRSARVRLERDARLATGASPFGHPSAGERGSQLDLGELKLESFPLDQRTVRLDLELQMVELGGELSGFIQYAPDLFSAADIERLGRNFARLLRGIVDDPDGRVAQLPLVSDQERQLLLDWNATAESFAPVTGLHALVLEQARRAPDADAVLYDGGRLSYRELVERAGRLSRELRAEGVGPEVPVALLMERSPDAVVGLLGILGAGGVAVPLEPGYPPERIDFMVKDCGAALVLTEDWLRSGSRRKSEGDLGQTRPDQAAFIFYTSGSTGNPKGVVLTHAGLCNCFQWFQRHLRLQASDRLLQKAPLGFDVAAWEIFWPLIAGAGVVLAAAGDSRDPALLLETCARHRVTVTQLVPSVLQLLLEHPDLSGTRTLRRVICGGEVLPASAQRRFFSRFEDVELYNFYGPTETSVAVTWWKCLRDDPSPTVPIGRPMANVTAHVLDEARQLVPIGVAGELYLGGACLARGYLRRDQLTRERFIATPFPGGERLYRTGDLVRRRADGNLEFLGRSDRQVKLRGLRIEPGEIEVALTRHPAVREAVVVARSDGGPRRLVAYVACRQPPPATSELRSLLERSLPAFMIPSAFVQVEALPIAPVGKRDLTMLPAPEWSRAGESFVAPVSPSEVALAALWQELFGAERVGIHDNFFELGGDSIAAVRLAAAASQVGLVLTPAQIFRYPTIAEMAPLARTAGPQPAGAANVVVLEPRRGIDQALLDGVVPALAARHPALVGVTLSPDGRFLSIAVDSAADLGTCALLASELESACAGSAGAHLPEPAAAGVRLDAPQTRALLDAAARHRTPLSTMVVAAASLIAARGRRLTVGIEREGARATAQLQIDERLSAGSLLASVREQLARVEPGSGPVDLRFHHLGDIGGALLRPVSFRAAAGGPSVESWVHGGELHLCAPEMIAGELAGALLRLGQAAAASELRLVPADFPQARASQQDLDAVVSQLQPKGGGA